MTQSSISNRPDIATLGKFEADRQVGKRPALQESGTDEQREDVLTSTVRKILVPVDLTTPPRQALAHALMLAARLNASIDLLHVTDGIYTGPLLGAQTKARIRAGEHARAKHRLELLAQSAVDQRVTVKCVVRSGLAEHEIVRTAEGLDVDMIVLGRRKRSPLLKLLFGSVSKAVLDTARCPVVVVPEKREDAELPSD